MAACLKSRRLVPAPRRFGLEGFGPSILTDNPPRVAVPDGTIANHTTFPFRVAASVSVIMPRLSPMGPDGVGRGIRRRRPFRPVRRRLSSAPHTLTRFGGSSDVVFVRSRQSFL